ncbi:MAG TPA: DNA mismatch repair protein MutS, partial [Candidatus Cloacimonas sp.]|nr:DNA mismatch repair protein MutS [Candidatus Cloacimonas sp.]
QTLVNSERYISPRLKEFEAKVLSSEEKIKNLEYELYKELRTELATHLPRLQRLSDIIGEIDVYSSMAYLAWQNHYCCPVFSENRNLHIEAGRHPVIEKLMGEAEFIPNDTQLDYPETCIALITGPNMAGKSTYLRQVGLLVILAQIGSYVPAN